MIPNTTIVRFVLTTKLKKHMQMFCNIEHLDS